MEDDVVGSPWRLDPSTRSALRLDRALASLWRREYSMAVVELEELLDDDPDHAEALRAVAAACMELGDHRIAAEALRRLNVLAPGDPSLWTQLARCCFELGDIAAATELAHRATTAAPYLSEAWFVQGMCADHTPGANPRSAFEAAWRLSPLTYPLPLVIDDASWAQIITEAFESLPAPIQQLWQNTPIRLEHLPTPADIRDASRPIGPRALICVEGTPPSDGGPGPALAIRVFRRNLAYAESIDSMVDDLAWALEQDALDWMDLTDDDFDEE